MLPKRKNDQLAFEIRFRNRVILLLIAILGFAMYKFATYPMQLTVYTPPDISKAFVQKAGDVPSTTIYGFARTMWETLNYCESNCQTEYPVSLNQYRAFLTKACYSDLSERFERQIDLQEERARRLIPTENAIFDVNNVKKVSSDMWYVVLEYILDDDIHGLTTRRQVMQYPLKITSNSTPSKYNPWGLAIDCYWQEPKVLEYIDLEEF